MLAITLGEFPGAISVVGVFLMMLGAYVLLWPKMPEHWSDYIGPLRHLRLLWRWGRLDRAEKNIGYIELRKD